MASYELVADTPLTKERQTPSGPNILLDDNTRIGRSTSGPGLLPINWAQVSGNHCRVFIKVHSFRSFLWDIFCLKESDSSEA
jgi:hypothetical protein